MSKGFELICPTCAETQLTGFVGGIAKEHRGRAFRVEFRNGKTVCTKNGEPVAWEDMPHEIRKAAHAGAAMLKRAREMSESPRA